jgi:hypothetical protein
MAMATTDDPLPEPLTKRSYPMTQFTIPLMLTVEADNYEAAFSQAENVAEGIGMDGENIYAAYRIFDYEPLRDRVVEAEHNN